ncbi:MAG: ABC transporter substrate-binding protein [Candidatus Competibacteraceae bacterium]|nr:ABC transporter substrate-binding protein [Candidatus Competibacteraceae bacterium]MBK8962974.1 ABC transporter substrate-binding protein [Candidatus Competibacteraceae bacterium]
MKTAKPVRFFASVMFGAALCGAGAVHAAKISISCGAVGQEYEFCKTGSEAWAKKTGNEINLVSTPNSATERLALYQQLLAAGAPDIDVFQIDVVWPGTLGNHFIDLAPFAKDAVKSHFPAIIQNNTIDGKLVAMPWFTDAGLLYYRKDLLEKHGAKPPQTWQELTDTAKKIQDAERTAGNDKMWGFVWQGRAYEGLTCNALEWVASYNGGTVVDKDGKITINNPQAVAALTIAGGWVKTISPEGVLNYTEEEARGVFQSGNAVFMRNWPYAWSLAQGPESAIKGKVGVGALPKGGADGRSAATLGGWQLSVSKYSKNKELAADLVMYLTSPEEQKRRAIKGAYNPTIESLYKDQEVLAAVPFFGELYDTFVNAVARPSTVTGAKYNQVSNEFWNAVYSVLSGKAKADASLGQLEASLKRMSRGGKW